MRRIALFMLLLFPAAGSAETLVAARTVRSQTILQPQDLKLVAGSVPGALSVTEEAVGLETRVVLYAGRPIRADDIGPAALIDRNQTVLLEFSHGPLTISTEGRSLSRGGVGDVVRVMNLASRTTVSGIVGADGIIRVPGGDHAQP